MTEAIDRELITRAMGHNDRTALALRKSVTFQMAEMRLAERGLFWQPAGRLVHVGEPGPAEVEDPIVCPRCEGSGGLHNGAGDDCAPPFDGAPASVVEWYAQHDREGCKVDEYGACVCFAQCAFCGTSHAPTQHDAPTGAYTQDQHEAAIAACVVAVDSGEVSLGEALRRHFPDAKTGDESPGMARRLMLAYEAYVSAWAMFNSPVRDAQGHTEDQRAGEEYCKQLHQCAHHAS